MSNVKNYTEQGGEKTVIGGELLITSEGKLTFDGVEVKPSALQTDSTAADVPELVSDFNALLVKLKAAGLMASE
ncbi:head fiber protein [Listeria innocua]|uniref:head fiber protein n=1 Tax=Listeria innocua TaxID=1642 RepID=UPI0011CB291B|nr:head fiber protein [Listeria innocua]MBM5615075.1 Head fiber protein [Listeria innocua]MBM5683959.1 Head fiber protein [Listeria innocua]TXJ80146.1 Head fiber protein [Listeria innocua]HBN5116520.1 Head fiber protein [Listeria innocua]HBN5117072.1 Head fiber protein [Listeria innocua]